MHFTLLQKPLQSSNVGDLIGTLSTVSQLHFEHTLENRSNIKR